MPASQSQRPTRLQNSIESIATAIMERTEALALSPLDDEQRAMVARIEAETLKLRRLISSSSGSRQVDVLCPRQMQTLREEFGAMLEELIALFRRTSEETLVEMEATFRSAEPARLGALAHRLKGSAANFGANRMVHACQRMEDAVREERTQGLKRLFTTLKTEYTLVSKALEA